MDHDALSIRFKFFPLLLPQQRRPRRQIEQSHLRQQYHVEDGSYDIRCEHDQVDHATHVAVLTVRGIYNFFTAAGVLFISSLCPETYLMITSFIEEGVWISSVARCLAYCLS
jgi:hypothetical protein